MKTFDFRSVPRRPGENGKPGDFAVRAVDANDQPFTDERGRIVVEYFGLREFLLGRTGDDSFIRGLPVLEGIELQLETRRKIKEQLALGDGLIVLEDAPAKRLADSILTPAQGYPAVSAPCLYPFLVPAKELKGGDLRELERDQATVEAPKN